MFSSDVETTCSPVTSPKVKSTPVAETSSYPVYSPSASPVVVDIAQEYAIEQAVEDEEDENDVTKAT